MRNERLGRTLDIGNMFNLTSLASKFTDDFNLRNNFIQFFLAILLISIFPTWEKIAYFSGSGANLLSGRLWAPLL